MGGVPADTVYFQVRVSRPRSSTSSFRMTLMAAVRRQEVSCLGQGAIKRMFFLLVGSDLPAGMSPLLCGGGSEGQPLKLDLLMSLLVPWSGAWAGPL